jgi:hypothetical protein
MRPYPFKILYRKRAQTVNVMMHIEHIAGNKMYVDLQMIAQYNRTADRRSCQN